MPIASVVETNINVTNVTTLFPTKVQTGPASYLPARPRDAVIFHNTSAVTIYIKIAHFNGSAPTIDTADSDTYDYSVPANTQLWLGEWRETMGIWAVAATAGPHTATLKELAYDVDRRFEHHGGELVNIRVISTTGAGTYTPPTGTKRLLVYVTGAGGGGGGGDNGISATGAGGGGGAGGTAKKFYDTPLAASYSYTVGAKGAGGAAGNNAGSDGGNSTFGALTAPGGKGGASMASASSAVIIDGGDGGVPTGGDINMAGSPGGDAHRTSATNAYGGEGGDSYWGGGGNGNATAGAGNNATSPGAGGGGGNAESADVAGGDGADGIIVIHEYR